jgi:type IV pilus assembly protein PilC
MEKSIDIRSIIQDNQLAVKDLNRSGSVLDRIKFSSRISDKDRSSFCTQLAVMLQAGVSLHRALQVLAEQTKNDKMKDVIVLLSKEIQKGNSFARALSLRSDIFDSLFVVTTEVGQETGRLPAVLSDLSVHLEKVGALKKKFRQALTYPALVITVAGFVVTFLLVFIVPAFADMFKNFQVEIPASTRLVLLVSSLLSEYGPYALVVAVTVLFLLRTNLRRPETRERLQSFSLRIPFFGELLTKNQSARFCRTLGTLLNAQVGLVDALQIAQRIFNHRGIKDEIQTILGRVKQGRSVSEPLVGSKFFPPMVAQMIAVGEETSELDKMLLKVADYYEKEVDATVDTLASVLEPVIIIFLGLIVATVVISMYLPMFDVVSMVGAG